MDEYPYRENLGGFGMNTKFWNLGYRNRQVQFLESAAKWDPLRGEWQPRKIVGFGSFGVVIQFEYKGTDPNMPKFMAVKQSSGEDLEQESIALQRIAVTGTDHVVKLYKAVHKDDGAGILGKKDPLPVPPKNKQVSRIYMEFARLGDMHSYMKRKELLGETNVSCAIPEEHLWRIMHCLARGFLVLATGSEDPKKPNPDWGRPIVHFDVKPGNILIGERDRGEHKRLNVFKLTDFGLALRVPDVKDGDIKKNKLWIDNTKWRATPGYAAPEQEITGHINRRIDSPTGIFSLGMIFYNMLLGDLIGETPDRFLHRIPNRMSFITHGSQLIKGDFPVPFSTHLINTVLRCLAYDPSDRPTAWSLVQDTGAMLEFWNKLQKDDPYPEETLLEDMYEASQLPAGAVLQDDKTPNWQTIKIVKKPNPAGTPIPDLDPTPNIPQNPLLFDQRPPEDPAVALKRYANNLKAAELAQGLVPAIDPGIEHDPARVAKQLELDAKLKQEADEKEAARQAQIAAEIKKQTDDALVREINRLQMNAPLTRFGLRGAIMRPRSQQAASNYQTAKPMTEKAAAAILGLLKPPPAPQTFKQRADATLARLEVQQQRIDSARDILGDPAFEAKVKAVLNVLSPSKLQRLPGQEDITYKADVDFAQRQRAEMIVSGQGDPDGGPDPRGFLERITDDWAKRAWAGSLPILGGFKFGDDDDSPMDES